jgi:hypothetical protein
MMYTANCIIIAQFPIETHSEQGRCRTAPENNREKCKIWDAIIMQFAVV